MPVPLPLVKRWGDLETSCTDVCCTLLLYSQLNVVKVVD
jgi:hypothetical protein